MLTAKNAKGWFAIRENADHIAEWVDTSNKRSSLVKNDIILSTRGTVGMCAIVTEEVLPANIDQDVARISWTNSAILPEFVLAYLNSSFGQDYMRRYSSGMVQQGLSLQKVREIPVPQLSKKIQTAIQDVVLQALINKRNSHKLILDAETLLLSHLGLEQWKPPEPLSYERDVKDVFGAGRLDAEYFKEKYVDLKSYLDETGRMGRLGNFLIINERGKQPIYTESGIPVINSKHVSGGRIQISDDNRFSSVNTTLYIRYGDVLMNGTGVGTIGRAAPYLFDFESLPDNHVTILRPKFDAIDPIYLSIFINSRLGQMQVEQRLKGSSGQIELYPSDIAEFLIWNAPKTIQLQIRELVLRSLAAKELSAQLLNSAKHAVEVAIEESETAALEFIKGVDLSAK